MKTLFSGAFAAAILLSGPVLADEAKPADQSQPIQLTAAQMDTVTAGAGREQTFGSPFGAEIPPWSALLAAGHAPTPMNPGQSDITVIVPR